MLRLLPIALCTLLALTACKGGAAAGGAASGQQNATYGGSGPGGIAPGARTDRAPQLLYQENLALRAEREFQARGYDGELRSFRELLHSDGLGQLRMDLTAVWNETTSSWVAPHPLYTTIYGPRSFFLVRHRDMHLGHEIGLYGNYAWELQPGTLTMAGRTCLRTRARSLHGFGPIDLVYEQATGLLLGWTLYDAAGTQVMAKLETTALDLNPNLTGVTWITDQVPEQPYEASAHDSLLGFNPRQPSAPPAGFYRAEARMINAGNLSSAVQFVYLERWSDGLRNLFLAQHKIPSTPSADGLLHTARRTQEAGVVTVEADMDDRRVFGISSLPHEQVEMVVASVLPE
jgi:hypothetical protein